MGYNPPSGASQAGRLAPIDPRRAGLVHPNWSRVCPTNPLQNLLPTAYSFVGACAQTPLLKTTGPRWVDMLQSQGVEAALLVPV